MATKKVSTKSSKPAARAGAAKKAAAKAASPKPAPKKTPAKKQAARKAAPAKKAPATPKQASAAQKAAAPKPPAARPKAAGPTTKAATRKPAAAGASAPATPAPVAVAKGKAAPPQAAKERPKASDFVKRPPHTPAVFKPASKRPAHIVFTLEEVREVIAKRAREEAAKTAAETLGGPAGKTVASGRTPALQPVVPTKETHGAASVADILGTSQPAGRQLYGPDNVPPKYQKYHKLLLELRDKLRAELNMHSNDTLKRSPKEDAGDLAISVDAGTDNFDRDFALSLLSSEQETLNEIEAAIQRIYNGTYGICEVTGKPIKAERLLAVPFTRFSLEGQREFEANAQRRANRTGAFLTEVSGEGISFGDDDAGD